MAFSFFHKNDLPQNKQVQDLPIAQLHPNRYQPRRTFSEESIKQLAQTLDEEGLLQPIIVREDGEGYEIVAGERRYRAAKSLGWEKIPAIVNNLSDAQTASLALIENLQRENLNPIDEALAYQELMKINNLTQTQLAQNIGKSQSYVANKLRLLKLAPSVQQSLAQGQISARHGRALLALDVDQQGRLLKEILDKDLSVKETEKIAADFDNYFAPKKAKKPTIRYSKDLRVQINTIKQAVKLAKEAGTKVQVKEEKTSDEYTITIVMKNQAPGKKED
ncbi:Chromosome partitioning protein ParB [Lactobacillus equicursoris 66c]|uniref:Chromosome partitioning protein ParB n=1 Tax=Lactobacillus equicursoris 66c TaxID=872326 RepID=K0NSR1_9LACO|nr:nucleoid occlusion protein [Lactobacillus equicursoris]MDD6386160.1 nucleoid occlusion protein [Lactobacillus equicursoris]CCK84173.1 Chromosome partitioning protein ParB [Lactobacillus equicursoris 66c]